MKAFFAALVTGVAIAATTSLVLNSTFQLAAHSAFTTEGARVSDPGDNLINY